MSGKRLLTKELKAVDVPTVLDKKPRSQIL